MTIFGQDIALDDEQQAKVLANGELALTSGVDTAVQDVFLRLITPLGSLFYDPEYGSRLYEIIHEDAHELMKISLPNEIARRLELDSRIVLGSVKTEVNNEVEKAIITVSWRFIDDDVPYNLVLSFDKQIAKWVVENA